MAADFVAVLERNLGDAWIALERHGDRKDGDRYLLAAEQVKKAPHADPAAVFVNRFHAHMAQAFPRLGADDFREECLRSGVTVKHAVLPSLLVVHHELHRDPRAARPSGFRRRRPVADQIARIRSDHTLLIPHHRSFLAAIDARRPNPAIQAHNKDGFSSILSASGAV